MIKFALLASGSKGNCCLVRNGDTSIIIDCGSTKTYLKASFERLQYDHQSSDALLITHTHSDHISQLKMFEDIQKYALCTLGAKHVCTLEPYQSFEINTLNITPLPTSHDSPDSCGYVIDSGEQRLVYVTDTGYVSEEMMKYMVNADYYIFESNHDLELLMQTKRPMFVKQRITSIQGHLCNEDSAEILSNLIGDKTKEIVLAHLSEEGNTHELAQSVLKKVLLHKGINYDAIKITSAPQFEIIRGGAKI